MQSIDTTTISGIRKTNDMILRSLINGSLDSRVVGATNSIIANQIRLLQQEETVEELTKTKKYLYDTQVAYFELASCQADQDLWFFSGLTEMLPQPLTDAINEFLEKKGEEIARTNPQINRWAYEYAFGKQSERWTAEAKAKMSRSNEPSGTQFHYQAPTFASPYSICDEFGRTNISIRSKMKSSSASRPKQLELHPTYSSTASFAVQV